MYVKVSPHNVGEQTIYEVEGSVNFGVTISKVPPAERLYNEELGVDFNVLHINGLEEEPSGQTLEGGDDWWAYCYAWWWGDGLEGVVTNHRIFILSNNGDTIDRVR